MRTWLSRLERDLAKVEVAGSNPVVRSMYTKCPDLTYVQVGAFFRYVIYIGIPFAVTLCRLGTRVGCEPHEAPLRSLLYVIRADIGADVETGQVVEQVD